jgi:hypothetical protein
MAVGECNTGGMPGARLTREDRERIAAGLAEGLDYAEIARRLGRPTSTVSREVARNLRPGGYRAAWAQQATLQRRAASRDASSRSVAVSSHSGAVSPDALGHSVAVSRDASSHSVAVSSRSGAVSRDAPSHSGAVSRDVPSRSGAASRDVSGRYSGAGFIGHRAISRDTAEFDERFAALMVETGLPRMAARVLGALVTTDDGALTARDLVARLRVSPASVSKAIAYLEALDVVRRERPPGRRERYVIDDDVWLQSWLTSARLHRRWSEAAREGAAVYGPDTPAGIRLERMGHFFGAISEEMTGGLDPQLVGDVLTLIAALVHAGEPCTPDLLAAALGWDAQRLAAALELVQRRADIGDPVAIHALPGGAFVTAANEHRLSAAQRAALDERASTRGRRGPSAG